MKDHIYNVHVHVHCSIHVEILCVFGVRERD